ncbi:gas vesicle protein GvpG [Streptomyces sp. NBC_01618]|uniref:gas vesicle protein GvpG n=1 Tax=Streptomyces sp. NBC_01618 TaxID=2975900 RepID=UPI003867EBAA
MGLPALPIAPVRGVVWVAEKLHDAAERELQTQECSAPSWLYRTGNLKTETSAWRSPARPAACCRRRPRAERSKVTHSWMTQPR